MKVEMTRQELRDRIYSMTTDEVVDFLVENGLELIQFETPTRGIYRREDGTDLIRFNDWNEWTRVNQYGEDETEIQWSYKDNGEWWVLVLDEDNRPYWGGDRVRFNERGERVE